ncbi:DUF4142 domain-containing protein [Archangium sp.]|uniref:DUF4142 domain-containing protein n=1 Tax=Archangium sp. TaxID=1872627 RepID=UPI00389A4B9D
MKRSLMIVALAFSTMAMAAAGAPTDPEIAHIAVTANQIDVDAAKFALTKTKNDTVKQFANTMITDHTGVIAKATELVTKLKVTPKDNPTSKSLKQNADKAKAELRKKSGADFDKAYVDNEVAYHEAVIGAVDTVLIPNAQNAELKALLTQVRPALQAHLEHARQLQSELAGGAATTGSHEHGTKPASTGK